MLRDRDKVEAIIRDWRAAPLTTRERALAEYAYGLTRRAVDTTEDTVAGLRAVGLDDAEILDACQIISYFNFVNRMADGLGVELEEEWQAEWGRGTEG